MTTENKAPENQQDENNQAELRDLLNKLYTHSVNALKVRMSEYDVEGQVVSHEAFGPMLIFHLKNLKGHVYSCGFFMNELYSKFRKNEDPATYLSSYFVDLLENEGGKPLPTPPQSEDEAKKLVEDILVPHCAEAIRAEFAPEPVHIQLDFHEQHGPVLEAGFQSITDGNNVCAVPLPIVMMHYLLNRDPADLMINGLIRIREEHGIG